MEGQALKLPFKVPAKLQNVELPRPTRWDFFAIGALVVALVLIAADLGVAGRKAPDAPFPSGLGVLFIVLQLAVSCGGLMLLGKTAKEGTWWGNLAALAAMSAGMGGVLLATALWAAA